MNAILTFVISLTEDEVEQFDLTKGDGWRFWKAENGQVEIDADSMFLLDAFPDEPVFHAIVEAVRLEASRFLTH